MYQGETVMLEVTSLSVFPKFKFEVKCMLLILKVISNFNKHPNEAINQL